jgi:hypothetical protein
MLYICQNLKPMSRITTETIISRRKDGLLVSELGNEMVMMDIESGNYIGLNETGRVIWELIDQPLKVNDLIMQLLNRYEIGYEECSRDTLDYLNKMDEQKILSY